MAESNKPPHQNPPQAPNPQDAPKPEPAVSSTDEFSPKPKVAEGKTATKEADTKESVHKKIEAILAQNGGRESDIPPSHEYWQLLNQYRSMK